MKSHKTVFSERNAKQYG